MNPYDPNKCQPDIFHAHLDECVQCRENPFNLCLTGVEKIHEANGIPAPPHQPRTSNDLDDLIDLVKGL